MDWRAECRRVAAARVHRGETTHYGRAVGLACRRGAAAGLTAERTGLIHRRLEVGLAVTERNPPLADRHAAIGLALDPAIDRDQLVGGAFDLDDAVHQALAGAVHGNKMGRAVAPAGPDDPPAGLQRYVCNQRVSD